MRIVQFQICKLFGIVRIILLIKACSVVWKISIICTLNAVHNRRTQINHTRIAAVVALASSSLLYKAYGTFIKTEKIKTHYNKKKLFKKVKIFSTMQTLLTKRCSPSPAIPCKYWMLFLNKCICHLAQWIWIHIQYNN